MIDDVLKDIREAEEKADEMLKRAYQRGKDIVLRAEAEAEAEKKSTVSECKQDRVKILQDARKQADERTNTILKRGAENAEYFIEEKKPAVEQCADKVVKILLGKYIANEQENEQTDEQAAEQTDVQPDGQTYHDIIQD